MRLLFGSFFISAVLIASAFAAKPPARKPAAPPPPPYRIEQGEIEGAKYTWARPATWNRNVLLIAHGFRSESAPLIADLAPEHAHLKALLNEGWLIAMTSYRRNGVIVQDAIKDLDNLRAEIVSKVGDPTQVIVEGDSMGGLIATLIAERQPEPKPLYDGVVAVGAALTMRLPSEESIGLTMQSKIPIVFLSNRSEFEPVKAYAEAKLPRDARPVVAFPLRVSRDGHVNVNQAERLFALRTLLAWIEQGPTALPKPAEGFSYVDATCVPEPQPSRVFLDADRRGFTAHITEVTSIYGNLALDAQPADFAAIGLVVNERFSVTVRERTFRAVYGRDFNTVKRGEWVVFPNADGFSWLARNNMSAAAATSAQLGDLVYVRKYDGPSTNASESETDAAK